MTGSSTSFDQDDDVGDSLGWTKPVVKGPPRAKLPLLTLGMLGLDVVWSAESGYGVSSVQL